MSNTSSKYNDIKNELFKLISIAKNKKKKVGFCIGNTSKKQKINYYITPIRQNEKIVVGGVIVFSEKVAIEIVNLINKINVDYILVDSEKKIPNPKTKNEVSNLERVVRENSKIKVLTYKGNDITVEAVDSFLNIKFSSFVNGLGGKKIGIYGFGNIGSKLALKLVERGSYIYVIRRNNFKKNHIIKTINMIKPIYNESHVSSLKKSIIPDLDVLIGATNGYPVINKNIIDKVKENVIIIDVGKNNITIDALKECKLKNIEIYRLDISSSFISTLSNLIYTEEVINKSFGRKKINNLFFVSGGMIGSKNDIVVDNIFNINKIYGIADGSGDFIHKLNATQKKQLNNLKKKYDKI